LHLNSKKQLNVSYIVVGFICTVRDMRRGYKKFQRL